MKFLVALAVLVAVAAAAPAEKDAKIISQYNDNIGVEKFKAGYETENGIRAESQGKLFNVGTEGEGLFIRGSYSYPGTDGLLYTVTYVADQNGFQPQGDHLPKNA